MSTTPKLIKQDSLLQDQRYYMGRLKRRSIAYQMDYDSTLVHALSEALTSFPPIRQKRITGKIIISLHLGGIQGVEFEESEKVHSENDLSKST